jgi:hypothetical protein
MKVQVTFFVIDHEILSLVICTVPLLACTEVSVPAKVKAFNTGKLLDSLPSGRIIYMFLIFLGIFKTSLKFCL